MTQANRTPLYHPEDHELLGFIAKENNSWVAQTIFGYTIERTTSKAAAERVLQEQGLSYLMGVWHYYDTDDNDWFPCILKEANEYRVTVIRTNIMGSQDPDVYKLVTLLKPNEHNLAKSQ